MPVTPKALYKQSHTHTYLLRKKSPTPTVSSGSLLLKFMDESFRRWTKNKKIKKSKNTSTNLLVENPTKSTKWQTTPTISKWLSTFFQLPKPFHTSSIHLGISMVHSPCSSICRASASFQKLSNTSHKFCSKVIQLMVHWWFGFLGSLYDRGLWLKGIYP